MSALVVHTQARVCPSPAYGRNCRGYQFAPESEEHTYDCPFTDSLDQRIALRVVMLVVFLVVALVWISLSLFPLYKEATSVASHRLVNLVLLRSVFPSCVPVTGKSGGHTYHPQSILFLRLPAAG